MTKKITSSKIKEITGATREEDIHLPSYYAPPFLDELEDHLKSRLSSKGGRPTIKGAGVVRKVRFSNDKWKKLSKIAEKWSRTGVKVSPAQVASTVIEEVLIKSFPESPKENNKEVSV